MGQPAVDKIEEPLVWYKPPFHRRLEATAPWGLGILAGASYRFFVHDTGVDFIPAVIAVFVMYGCLAVPARLKTNNSEFVSVGERNRRYLLELAAHGRTRVVVEWSISTALMLTGLIWIFEGELPQFGSPLTTVLTLLLPGTIIGVNRVLLLHRATVALTNGLPQEKMPNPAWARSLLISYACYAVGIVVGTIAARFVSGSWRFFVLLGAFSLGSMLPRALFHLNAPAAVFERFRSFRPIYRWLIVGILQYGMPLSTFIFVGLLSQTNIRNHAAYTWIAIGASLTLVAGIVAGTAFGAMMWIATRIAELSKRDATRV